MIFPSLRMGFSALLISLTLAGCYQSVVLDEAGAGPGGGGCSSGEFACETGGCIPADLACDGIPHCGDSSDESPLNLACTSVCDPDEFECGGEVCIPLEFACDGVLDCADSSDESPVNPVCGMPACTEDVYEENDDFATALVVAPVPMGIPAQICSGDPDYFQLTTFGAGELTIQIQFDQAEGDLDMRFLDSDTNLLAFSLSDSDDEEIIWEVTPETVGTYYFIVYGYNGAQNDYIIDLNFAPTSP